MSQNIRTDQVTRTATDAWTDWSPTITGYSSITTSGTYFRYKQIGKTVFIQACVNGTSNSAEIRFTLPAGLTPKVQNGVSLETVSGLVVDNGALQSNPARIYFDDANNVIQMQKGLGTVGWTTSGNKQVRSEFFYEVV